MGLRNSIIKETIHNKLPNGYVELEYVESQARNCAIDTGYKMRSTDSWEARITLTNGGDNWYGSINNPKDGVNFYVNQPNYGYGSKFATGITNTVQGTPFIIKRILNAFYINGAASFVTAKETFVNVSTFYLFSGNNKGAWSYPSLMRVFYHRIWDEHGVPIRDFVPCLETSTNIAGMYDLITKQFYHSITGTELVAGPIKQ